MQRPPQRSNLPTSATPGPRPLPQPPSFTDRSAELVLRARETADADTRKDLLRRALDLECTEEEQQGYAGLWARRFERGGGDVAVHVEEAGDEGVARALLGGGEVSLRTDARVVDELAGKQQQHGVEADGEQEPLVVVVPEPHRAQETQKKQPPPPPSPRVAAEPPPTTSAKPPSHKDKDTKAKRTQAPTTLEPAPNILETPIKSRPLPPTPSTPLSPDGHLRSPHSSIQSGSSGASTPGRKKPKKLEVRSPRSPAAAAAVMVVEAKGKRPKKLEIRSVR